MKRFPKPIFRLLLAVVLLVPAVFAQEVRSVDCRFLRFGGEGRAVEVVTKDPGGEEVTCVLSASSISETVKCAAPGNVVTFASPESGETVASVTIPATTRAALLVFMPGGAGKWRVLMIDDSRRGFPDGGAYLVNFHSEEVAYIVGEHRGLLKAGGRKGLEAPRQRDAFNMAPVVVRYKVGKTWKTANESALRFLPGLRYLLFAFPDAEAKRVRLRTFLDGPPKA